MFLSAISIDSCVIINYIIYKTFLSLLITCFHYRRNIQIKDCFEINSKQTIKMSKKDEYLKFKNFEKKVKSPFMIYAYFESILVLKIIESKIQMSLMSTNMKKMLLVVMVIN